MHHDSTPKKTGRPANLITISIEGSHGCWIPSVKPDRSSGGYVRVWNGEHMEGLHRLTYRQAIGPIPPGHEMHHAVCENPPCCNPLHVIPMIVSEHHRLSHARFTHCPQGHPFSGENLMVKVRANGDRVRICRTCQRAAGLDYYHRLVREQGRDIQLPTHERTHCPKGHPYSGDNLIQRVSKQGGSIRDCRACRRESSREWARRKREQRRGENAPA